MLKIKNGKLVTDKLEEKNLYIENGKIVNITEEDLPCDSELDAKGCYVSAGFIDTHVHGGGGHEFMDGGVEPMRLAAKTHLKYGTTSICPTSVASTDDVLKEMVLDYKELVKESGKNGLPNFVGMHLEGPYFSPREAGAQPPQCIYPPNPKQYNEVIAMAEGHIAKWSFAPELEGAVEFCDTLAKNNIIPSIGHTAGTYEDVLRVYQHGAKCLTHFYSSMTTITRRNGYRILGVVEAGYLLDDLYIEVIADGSHLPPELLKMICKNRGIDRIHLITDGMRGVDMPDGETMIGRIGQGQPAIIEDGIAKVPDRSCFAGSVATSDRLVRTMVKKVGFSVVDAVGLITKCPAELLGLKTKGRIEVGFDADIAIFDETITAKAVLVGGNIIHNNT